MPFGVPGKLFGMVLFLGGVGALLWYLIFPAVDPLLPFNDVQVTAPNTHPAPSPHRSAKPTQSNLPR